MHEFSELWPMVDGAIIGALGGLVNGLRQKTIQDWSQAFIVLLTAGFSGMLAQLLSGWLGADVRMQFAVSGIAGYSGGVLLDDVVKRARELINKGGDILAEKLDAQAKHEDKHEGKGEDREEASEASAVGELAHPCAAAGTRTSCPSEAETFVVVPNWK